MKFLILGDIHGHNSWVDIVKNEKYDKVIFLGDYVDSFSVKRHFQFENLKSIIDFKLSDPDNVILIYGNHDHSYLNSEQCSGWNTLTNVLCGSLLDEMYRKELFQPVFVHENTIFSHAGVSKYWLENISGVESVNDISFKNVPLSKFNYNDIFFDYTFTGNTISQSPIWIRPQSLIKSKIDGYQQVVGHTQVKDPFLYKDNGLYMFDTLPTCCGIYEDGNINFLNL